MPHKEDTYLTCLYVRRLWEAYSLEDSLLTQVKLHLTETHWLSEEGKWGKFGGEEVCTERFTAWDEDEDDIKSLVFFSDLFDVVLRHLRGSGHMNPVKGMVYVGSIEPESTRTADRMPDAFLCTTDRASPTTDRFAWRDLVCPFAHKSDDGEFLDNDPNGFLEPYYVMRNDPRRTFSFGVTVHGTMFRIWLLSQVAPFTFFPFDWIEDPDSLLKFFILLATSSSEDLGLDTSIKRIGGGDFDLQFTIQETAYHTSRLLYDIDVGTAIGQGIRVFDAVDQKTGVARAIKEYWVESYPRREMEHDVVSRIKGDMADGEDFCKRFIDICGHQNADTSRAFDSLCKILNTETLMLRDLFGPQFLIPATDSPELVLTHQPHLYEPALTKWTPVNPSKPRSRYQAVYGESGISLFKVASFTGVFAHLGQAADALDHLHRAGWVHGDFTPGNIIVVGTTAKVSGMEFAERRVVDKLGEMTSSEDTSSATEGTRTGILCFAAIEVEGGRYMFLPKNNIHSESELLGGSEDIDEEWTDVIPPSEEPGTEPPEDNDDAMGPAMDLIEPIFLCNPLHDYESVWWVAVWFVFHCKPNGIADPVMERAREMVYESRPSTFALGGIERACKLLPTILKPLGKVLVGMKDMLTEAYRSFEESFNGSGVLLTFQKLRRYLQMLVIAARGLGDKVKPPVVGSDRGAEVEQAIFSAVPALIKATDAA